MMGTAWHALVILHFVSLHLQRNRVGGRLIGLTKVRNGQRCLGYLLLCFGVEFELNA